MTLRMIHEPGIAAARYREPLLQQLIEKQNETLAALVEEKVAKLHELAGQQDKKHEEIMAVPYTWLPR